MIDSCQIRSDAFGRWPGILQALGVGPEFLKNEHGPCPICGGGKDRFRFDDRGNGDYYCSQCKPGDGFDLLMKMHGWRFPKAKEMVAGVVWTINATPIKTEQDAEAKARYMRKIWKESTAVTEGDPVWLYLSRRCGNPAATLQDLRFHPGLEHSVDKGKHPALLAGMGWDGKKFSGIHRTYLTSDGQKAPVDPVRMSYGELGAVRLGPLLARIGVAEGIETAICASKQFNLPVWAAISAGELSKWAPPIGVESVVVLADNDQSYTGQAAAFTLANRLKLAGVDVSVEMPPAIGTDFADSYLGEVS